MLLYLVRHGIAIDRDDPKCPDEAERYLTEEGIKKTREVAKGVASLIDAPEIILSSPYVRAWQTAELFAAAFKIPKQKSRRIASPWHRCRSAFSRACETQGHRVGHVFRQRAAS